MLAMNLIRHDVLLCIAPKSTGKTTCMAMLTAEFPPSSGDAILAGFSVTNEPDQTRRTIGYCPQFDAHFANMTGAEHVELYAIIKGVRRDLLKEVVAAKLDEVGLSVYDGNRLSSSYSGGMKRKLSVAIATIGSPRIVFLDEPSTGMDPVARRDLWKVISTMVQGRSDMLENKRTSVILTTHSMEECEALCPRIGIMAGGRLRCLGSAQHLKSRFGEGYQIEMKVKHPLDQDFDVLKATRLILGNNNNNGLGTDLEAVDLHKLAADTSLNLDQAKAMCIKLTGDDYLSKIIHPDNPNGYPIFKVANSPVGVCAAELVGFCAEELRVKALVDFFEGSYNSAILRERQGVKLRYEIASKGVTISSVFATIEEHKETFHIDEYGVSQTSLEQVFNR
jgi:ATP-binding cassette subfamily A (ABC1) protein 3